MDRDMLRTEHGHVAVGWLIVEDIFTVLALVLVPMLGPASAATGPAPASPWAAIAWALLKLVALVAIVLLAGSRVVPWVLTQVAKLRSTELFTLSVLVLSITIAVGSATIFGASVALGAFLAGMVVGQSPLSHQAAADALPMRDAFSVLFFVSVGMLFDPSFLVAQPLAVVAGLAIALVFKPLAAVAIVATLGYPARTALTVALGLAQIGEFSFILGQVARDHALLPEDGMNILVATAMISITLNPLLFRSLDRLERMTHRWPALWRLLNARSAKRAATVNAAARHADGAGDRPLALIVGYGPVGRLVDALLRDAGLETVIVETNIDTVQSLARARHPAVYGDATRKEVLEQAGVRRAAHLIVTLPHTGGRAALVMAARELNPTIEVTVRARYLAEHDTLNRAGAARVIYEEGEAGVAMAEHVMMRRGLDRPTIDRLLVAVRQIWRMRE
jgi:CPA2 family monovalent cation:H+ antiporter-2